MPGPLSNIFSSNDDGAQSSQDARMPVSSIDGHSDDSDASQQQRSFEQSDHDGDSNDAPAFSVSSEDPGVGGGLTDDYLTPE